MKTASNRPDTVSAVDLNEGRLTKPGVDHNKASLASDNLPIIETGP